jgi:hypothetical protein
MKRLIVVCLFLTGCGLYLGGGDDQCTPTGLYIPAIGYRDPSTGTCVYQSSGGGQCCGGAPCAYNGVDQPDWGMCNSQCDALDESTCIATAACHAAYVQTNSNTTTSFLGCWQTSSPQPPSSPCAGLDANGCDGRDDCSMVYTSGNGGQLFSECVAETQGSCGVDIGCPTGSHCSEQCAPCNGVGCSGTCSPTCVPDATCAQTTCGAGYQCVVECNALVGPCQPTCVPTGNNPGACTGQILCNSAPPQCPVNTTAGIANGCWTGYCIPNAQCSSPDPGDCYGTVTCNMGPPSCPSGTLPGVTNGCYSGFCIPTYSCELAACETFGTQSACEARSDCTPIYTGNDCTCTMTGGCICATETYARCESTMMPL